MLVSNSQWFPFQPQSKRWIFDRRILMMNEPMQPNDYNAMPIEWQPNGFLPTEKCSGWNIRAGFWSAIPSDAMNTLRTHPTMLTNGWFAFEAML